MAKDSSITFNAGTSEAMSRFHGSLRKAFTGYYRIKDFIRLVRACKTAADERKLVAKESAAIRNSFKGGSSVGREQRYQSLGKLIYVYLLGYPAIFGQVECMKLAANASSEAARFKDKRLGYLGVTLLSDEHQETLTLVTNSLKFDLNSPTESIQALALNTLSLLASISMARELATEVELLMVATSANIRKRAVACATKLIQKDPELIEIFEPRLSALLSDQSHPVLLTTLTFFQTILSSSGYSNPPVNLKFIPCLVKLLKTLQTTPLDTEYDISGVSDPLLQINILRTIRQIAKSTEKPLESDIIENLNDLLAQLATTLDTSKNVGNGVLYEVVLTIMSPLPLDQSLVNLAIGTLGRFLTGNSCGDNNLRYVALNLLTKILIEDDLDLSKSESELKKKSCSKQIVQIQKHQATILACLHDADSTIRKKAADLSLLLINSTEDLIQIAPDLLELCQRTRKLNDDQSQTLLDKLAKIIRKFATDPVVFINLSIKLLKQVDSVHPAKNEIVSEFIEHAIHLNHVQVVRELFFALTILEDDAITASIVTNEISNSLDELDSFNYSGMVEKPKITLPSEALLECAFWFFGEFGQIVSLESLCTSCDLVNLLAAFAISSSSNSANYALTALAKLSTRLPDQVENIQGALMDARDFFHETNQFFLLDRTVGLLKLVKNEKMRKISFEPIEIKSSKVLDLDSTVSIENNENKNESIDSNHHSNHSNENIVSITPPALILNHLNVYIDQSETTSSNSLQLQLIFKSDRNLKNIAIALAVPRGFDFDYLAPASGTILNSTIDYISLSILIKKLPTPESSNDLLDFSNEIGAGVKEVIDWNDACIVKIKVNYLCGDDDEAVQKIGQLPRLL